MNSNPIPVWTQVVIGVLTAAAVVSYTAGQLTGEVKTQMDGFSNRLATIEGKQDRELAQFAEIEDLLRDQNVEIVIIKKDLTSLQVYVDRLHDD